MNKSISGLGICVALFAATAGFSVAAYADTSNLTVLQAFGYRPEGEYPEGPLVQGPDGTLYGTTSEGGVYGYGMVFAITTAGVLTELHSFDGDDGQTPISPLIFGSDGNLYGTVTQGLTDLGNSSYVSFGGTVFKMSTTGGGFTTLHSFSGNGLPDGTTPGDITDGGNGYFYGTTEYGGAAGVEGLGTVFKVAPDGTFVTLHSFSSSESYFPAPGLTKGADGNFYGASPNGGANGTLFKVTPAGVVSIFHTFTGTDGANPNGRLLLSTDGNFYGTTRGGGTSGDGTLFKLSPTGVLTTIYSFDGAAGVGPAPGLVQTADGTFYGFTSSGGDGYGVIFRITSSGVATALHLFEYADGEYPAAGPILGADGLLYGTTVLGGGGGDSDFPAGTIFKFDQNAVQPPVLTLNKYCYNEFDECFKPFNTFIGESFGLGWSSANVSSCVASGDWSGSEPSSGGITISPTKIGRLKYTLTCQSAQGPISAKVTVTVGP